VPGTQIVFQPPSSPQVPPFVPMEPQNVEEGTEVFFVAPPNNPGKGFPKPPPDAQASVTPPRDVQTYVAPPPPPEASPPPYEPPSQPVATLTKKQGLLGSGEKNTGKVTKTQIADALELTRFALAALEDKDAGLAADRLQQALKSLGR